jgi:hypothetical protein
MNDADQIEIIENVDEHADVSIDLGCGDDNPYQK